MMIKSLKQLAIASSLLAAVPANAALVTLYGTTVNYVYDDAQAALALFGTPTIVGDTVRFLPPSFRAESVDGAGTVITAANFLFTDVYSVRGAEIADISVTEFGDYEITNGGTVTVDLMLTASSNANYLDFTSNSAGFNASGDSSGLQTWQINTSIDPSQAFTLAPATSLALSIQNTLTATTNAFGEVAWIQKKLSFVATTEVPVPAAAWLFGSALMGLVGFKRKS